MTANHPILALALIAIAGCASVPAAPDPSVDIAGRWTVTAVNGRPTGGGTNFFISVTPPTGSAQFGCNRGSGSLAAGNGWLSPGDWIITVAGCANRDIARFEREGFDILGRPAAVERRTGGVRLRNAKGSIDLVKAASQ